MRNALIRYRFMAYLVGTLLVVLVCIGLPLKYLPIEYGGGSSFVVTWTAIPHGYLYMVLLITAVDLGRRAHWSWKRLLLIALAGTLPFLSFVAERSATKDVKAKLAEQQSAGASADPASDGARVDDVTVPGSDGQPHSR